MDTPKLVRTRYAPSPTGQPHIGGARTALFSYLWAKKNGGDFILRIEDTDQERFVEGSLEANMEGLRWLGIQWDEGPEVSGAYGPYFQSERLPVYTQYAKQLIDSGKAYYCFCTSERLEVMRKELQAQKLPPRYDRRCRYLGASEIEEKKSTSPYVIRLAVPEEGSVIVRDVLRGDIEFLTKDIDDQVLMKSDGFPTYHLANVVDDRLMEITHVIRAQEWLPSTPKHVLLYNYFGWEVPEFVHLSVFLAKQGGKMSKRHGETSLLAFRDNGYMPEAIVNFIALLGWNPKTTEEFFTLQELCGRFELTMINIQNPVFDEEKLNWMNQQYMKKVPVEDMLKRVRELSQTQTNAHAAVYTEFLNWFEGFSPKRQESIWNSLRERAITFLEVARTPQTLTLQPYEAHDLVWKKTDVKTTLSILSELQQYLSRFSNEQLIRSHIEPQLLVWIQENGWGNGDVLWPLRFALSGARQSPSPFELMELLGSEQVLNRLQQAYEQLSHTQSTHL